MTGQSSHDDGQSTTSGMEPGPHESMKVHPWVAILVAVGWPAVGFLLCFVVHKILKVDIPKIVSTPINLVIGFAGVLWLFPIVYRAPFGRVPLREYLRRIGFYLPAGAWRHAVLGIVLAGCTLSGMLVGSFLTGRYVVDWSKITLGHTVYSLSPGILEEIFYRGIMVMLLLPLTRSVRKAAIVQILIFGLAHIKETDWVALVDVVSVMVLAVAFTYVAYKTRALLTGIVFHFLHDALLFLVQVPDENYNGVRENTFFYGSLWLMTAVACGIIWYATDRLGVRAEKELYVLEPRKPGMNEEPQSVRRN